jgi:hypothetical protein
MTIPEKTFFDGQLVLFRVTHFYHLISFHVKICLNYDHKTCQASQFMIE